MDKQLIERIALEVCDPLDARKIGTYGVCEFAHRFLERIDAERGKDAIGWATSHIVKECLKGEYRLVGMQLRQVMCKESQHTVPVFLSPTIPKGMVMIDKKLLSTTIELTKEASETEFNRQPLSDELYGISLMLAAAQGERNAD